MSKKSFYYKFNIVPWQKLNHTTFFVVKDASQDINYWIKARYGDGCVLIEADGKLVLDFLNLCFSVSELASNYLCYKIPNFSAKTIKLGSIFFASFLIRTSILTLTEKYTYFALMSVFIVGCSSYLFKFIITVFGLCETYNRKIDYNKINEGDFPIHAILFPAFKEGAVIKQLIGSIESLDYPKSKLDVKLLTESDGQEMLLAVEKHILPQYFGVIKVPHSFSKTKARSCNYDMGFAKEKCLV